jgi:hypothetical protein
MAIHTNVISVESYVARTICMYILAVWKRSFLKLKTIVESVLFVKGGS